MKKRWKKSAALCLAVLLTGFVPMGTIQAAEQSTELQVQEAVKDAVQEEISEPQDAAGGVTSEETPEVPDPADETEEEAPAPEGADDASRDDVDAAPEETPESVQDPETDEAGHEEQEPGPDGESEENNGPVLSQIKFEKETMQPEQPDNDSAADSLEPVIDVKLPGNVQTRSIGGQIEYTYIGNHDQRIYVSVEQGIALYYYFEALSEMTEESRSEEQLSSLWQGGSQNGYQEIALNQDGKFILYLKADAGNGQTISLRTDGMVVDTAAPVITGIDNGGSYPEGTPFHVNDDNLAAVKINEQAVEPSTADGAYQLTADGASPSCVIRAVDRAGNETVYSVTVEQKNPDQDPDKDPDQDPDEEISIIDMNGTYSLQAGKAYRLGIGRWTLNGDPTVYCGDSTFYVSVDGDYTFQRKK